MVGSSLFDIVLLNGGFALFIAIAVLILAMPITAFVPTRGARRAFFMLLIVTGWCLYLTTEGNHREDRTGLGSLIVIGQVAYWLLAAAIGFVALALQRSRDSSPTFAGGLLFGIAAGFPVPFLLLVVNGIFSRIPGVALTIGLAAVIALLVQQTFSGWKASRLARPFDAYGFTCLAAAIAITVSFALGYVSATRVAKAASMAAAGRAYCLQSGYRVVTSLLDLSALTLRERKYGAHAAPTYLHNHGLLIIATENGPDVLNWSYRQQRFMHDSLANSRNTSSRPESLCVPPEPASITAG